MSEGPSTEWRETIAPDEAARFARQGEILARLQAEASARYGAGRLAHRKSVIALSGTLQVLGDLPPHARFGLFAEPRIYRALVRLSNAHHTPQPDSKPDVRGFAVKALGVSGAATLGGPGRIPGLSLCQHDELQHARQPGVHRRHLRAGARPAERAIGGDPPLGSATRDWALAAAVGEHRAPIRWLCFPDFRQLAPFAVGPYAARAQLRPLAPSPAKDKDYAGDMRARLAAGPIVYEIALQFFVDEARTPIEDATVVWSEAVSPATPVARLTLTAEEGDVEKLRFDPWGGLADHRPLGEIMRARKAAYFTSHKGRGAL